MAEYYPLLAKAVAGLPNSTPEVRRAVYDRARKALIAQLRNLDPPISDSDVARETEALANAVARLEAELARQNGHALDRGAPASQSSTPQPASPPKPGAFQAPGLRPAPSPNGSTTAAKDPAKTAPLSAPPRPTLSASPKREQPPPLPGLKPVSPSTKPGVDPLAGAAAAKFGLNQKSTGVGETEIKAPPSNGAGKMPAGALNVPKPGTTHPHPEDEEANDGFEHHGELGHNVGDDEDGFEHEEEPRVEAVRLYAPQQLDADDKRSSFRLWLVGGIVAVVVAAVAVAAWTLRDRPDEIAKLKAPAPTQTDQGNKIAERITGAGQQPDDGTLSPNGAPTPGATDNSPQPAAQPNAGAANQATNQAATNQAAAKPGDTAPGVPVAYRAALLVEAPEEANKVKTYLGTVVWRLDNVSGGSGQPVGTAIHADVDIPGDKIKVSFTLQKNTDPSLPASHTMTINFMPQPDSPSGGVKEVGVVQMRQDDTPKGEPLLGVPVPIMENSFLIGLSRGAAEATNLQLIKGRPWFDVPMRLDNGKIAKLTFEKGTSGARALEEAFASWQSQ